MGGFFSAKSAMILSVAATMSMALPAHGARYGEWSGNQTQMERMVSEMEGAIDTGERERSAHPAFIRDLRRIIAQYKVPDRTDIFKDDFSDGDHSRNPRWRVVEGSFEVDRFGALYSAIEAQGDTTQAQPTEEEPRKLSKNERNVQLALGVLGLLNRGQGGQESDPEPTAAAPAAPSGPTRAVIHSAVKIDNAFTAEFTLRSDTTWGEIGIGFYQGNALDSGYRLLYHPAPSANRPLELVKYLRGRPSLVASAGASSPSMDDGRDHTVILTRDRNGEMTVSVDGQQVLSGTDMSYRDAFAGIAIINEGGLYGIDNIQVYSTR